MLMSDHAQYLAALLMRSMVHGKRAAKNEEEAIEAERKALDDARNYLATMTLVDTE